MTKIPFYQVDAFAEALFKGNPAGVCLLADEWLPEALMQDIAMEKNLSETAFVLRRGTELSIRWFTPVAEVDLCGHATLAAAHVLFEHEGFCEDVLVFQSRLYTLRVAYEDGLLTLDFPRDTIHQIAFRDTLDCFNVKPLEVWHGTEEYLLVFASTEQVRNAVCDLPKAAQIDLSGFIITAKSDIPGVDFVSRYFSPKFGLDEDPVTGSAHTLLVPYWQAVLHKNAFCAMQLSKRGGTLYCRAVEDRVKIGGKAVTFFAGELLINGI